MLLVLILGLVLSGFDTGGEENGENGDNKYLGNIFYVHKGSVTDLVLRV